MMSLKEVLQQCPKAAQLYYKWAGQALRELQKQFADQVPADMESHLPDIDKEVMKSYGDITIDTNPRNLYDFFDKEGITMELGVDRTMEPKFCYSFNTNNSDLFLTRAEAEIEGFTQAFKLLEEKLNK